MRELIEVFVALLLAVSCQFCFCEIVADCDENDGDTFLPWKEYKIAGADCSLPNNGQPGSCSAESDCRQNQGSPVDTSSPINCRKLFGSSSRCCVFNNNCTATSSLSSGGQSLFGVCLLPRYCTQGTSAKSGSASCGGRTDFGCCVEQERSSLGVTCSERYSAVRRRLSFVDLHLDQDLPVFSSERLTNFLPFAMKTFDNLRNNNRCLPMGDCSSATYLAFFYHMLVDFTVANPERVLAEILNTIPTSTSERLQNGLLNSYDGHLTPEAFGKMMEILWDDQALDLVQYNSGTCSDWIRLSRAVQGVSSTWRCDDRWFALMAAQYCRPTLKTNLEDCAQGAGVCYLNGLSTGVCASYGLTENTLSTARNECTGKYGANTVCCLKPEVPDTTVSFNHNQYSNIRIAIEPDVPESSSVLDLIYKTFTEASHKLYHATQYRATFGLVRVILPSTWSSTLATGNTKNENLSNAEFVIQPDVSMESDGIWENTVTLNTIQLGFCGARGIGTRLTPRDLNGTISAANIAKHFAFNRYGIFREFPRNEMEMTPLDALRDPPPRCVKDDSTYYTYCEGESQIRFVRDSTVTGSLAWLPDYHTYPGVENIVHFCDNRECDSSRNHNDEMDNTQNRICNKKSTLEVILDNDDFYGSGTPPRPGLDSKPKFVVVHPNFKGMSSLTKTRIVLLLDQSGSMSGIRMANLQQAAYQFIEMADVTIEIAIVTFESQAFVRSTLKRCDESGKSSLKSTIYKFSTAGGGTCIQYGMNRALSLLSGKKGGHIILMTDGENGCGGDFTVDSMSSIVEQGATVHTVAITKEADKNLQKLAMETGGQSHLVSNGQDVTQFLLDMQTILLGTTEDDTTQRAYIQNQVVTIRSGVENDISIWLDIGLSTNNLVSVIFDNRAFKLLNGLMIPPVGSGDKTVQCDEELQYGKVSCAIKFKPTAGQWTLRLKPASQTGQPSNVNSQVTVTASATIDITKTKTFKINGIIARSKISLDQPEYFWERSSKKDKRQAIVATLSFGRFAIIGATVEAVISHAESNQVFRVQLLDNGDGYNKFSGADLYENDGIYSAVLDQLTKVGRYSVILNVTADQNEAFYTPDVLVGVPKSTQFLAQTTYFRIYVKFSRSISIGMFEVTATSSSSSRSKRSVDKRQVSASVIATPGLVANLELIHTAVAETDVTYTLKWLAVGKNGMEKGTAPEWYSLVASTNPLEVQGRGDEIDVAQRIDGRLVKVVDIAGGKGQVPGSMMLGSISLPTSEWIPGTKIYFGVTAYNYDLNGQPVLGATSNIVIAKIKQFNSGVCDSYGVGDCVTKLSDNNRYLFR